MRPRETLSSISRGYGVPLATLLALNDISNPDLVKTGTVLKVKGTPPAKAASQAQAAPKAEAKPATPAATPQPKPATPAATAQPAPASAAAPAAEATPPAAGSGRAPDWRSYGPLQVDWSGWQPMGGSLVAPSLNADGLSFYLSINCEARKLNATNKDGQWQTWEDPTADFERKLIDELCSNPPQ